MHGAGVLVADAAALSAALAAGPAGVLRAGEADAVVAAIPNVAVGVATADCLPILLAAPGRAVAAVHAGWRGIAAGVVAAALEALRRLGAPPAGIRAHLGPAVCRACYGVGDDVAEAWRRAVPGDAALERGADGRWRADLAAAARAQLLSAGVPAEAVRVEDRCTLHEAGAFFSYRREGSAAGRQVSAVRLVD